MIDVNLKRMLDWQYGPVRPELYGPPPGMEQPSLPGMPATLPEKPMDAWGQEYLLRKLAGE